MKIEITPGTPGAARVEYYACREEVEAMLAKGYNTRNVYDHLKGQGRLTCSYSAFCDYVRGGGKRKHSKSGKKPVSGLRTPPLQTQENKPGLVTPEPRKNRSFDVNSADTSKLF